MSLSNYAENLVLNWLLTDDAATRPTSWWIALHSSDPTEAGTQGELTGGGYARTAVNFTTATAGESSNDALATFPEATSDWLPATHMSVWTAQTSGQLLFSAPLDDPQTVATGQVLEFKVGTLAVQMD